MTARRIVTVTVDLDLSSKGHPTAEGHVHFATESQVERAIGTALAMDALAEMMVKSIVGPGSTSYTVTED